MTQERYNEIDLNDGTLTKDEIQEGWFFCPDCDYLLTNDCCLDRIKNDNNVYSEKQIEF